MLIGFSGSGKREAGSGRRFVIEAASMFAVIDPVHSSAVPSPLSLPLPSSLFPLPSSLFPLPPSLLPLPASRFPPPAAALTRSSDTDGSAIKRVCTSHFTRLACHHRKQAA